jgi:hypothetical protein
VGKNVDDEGRTGGGETIQELTIQEEEGWRKREKRYEGTIEKREGGGKKGREE